MSFWKDRKARNRKKAVESTVLYSFYSKNCELFYLDLGLDILDGVRGLHLQGDGLARQGLHKDLHGRLNTGVKPCLWNTAREYFNVIYYHIFYLGNVMENLSANVWIRTSTRYFLPDQRTENIGGPRTPQFSRAKQWLVIEGLGKNVSAPFLKAFCIQ